ncbi:MAG: serine/threonine-protein phosphatase [Anaerolineae bacterium]|nr:serine/threonine-protein phosphatase [Anaerolineae bacterium]
MFGQGIPAALFMALATTVLRFGMSLNLSPSQVIDRANRLIIRDQRSRLFATVFLGYLDPASGAMAFACAGHNPPLLYRAATRTCESISAEGCAIGVFQNAVFGEEITHLTPGDLLVLYTDGITEIINADDDEFGEAQLEALIIANAHLPAQALTQLILREINAFAGEEGAADDETLLIVKRNPAE